MKVSRSLVTFTIVLVWSAILPIWPPSDTDTMAQESDGSEFSDIRIYQEGPNPNWLYRAAFGDLIPERPGLEMATCSKVGKVAVHSGSGKSWSSEVAWRSYFKGKPEDPTAVHSIDAGELYPENPGDEIVVVDRDFSATMIYRKEGGWAAHQMWRGNDWKYNVKIADLDGDGKNEVLVVGESVEKANQGYTGKLTLLEGSGLNWSASTLLDTILPIDACAIGELIEGNPGPEIVTGGVEEELFLTSRSGDSWTTETICNLGSTISDVAIMDMDPRYHGNEVYASTNDGHVYLVYLDGSEWKKEIVHFEDATIYGIAGGTMENGEPTLSIASWNKRVGLIRYDGVYVFKEIYREQALVMGTAIFDLDPTHPGEEVFCLSYYGWLTMLYSDLPGASLVAPFTETEVAPGDPLSIPIIVEATGGYMGDIGMIANGLEASPSQSSLRGGGFATIDLKAPATTGNHTISITATTPLSSQTVDISISVREGAPHLVQYPEYCSVNLQADRQARLEISVDSETGVNEPVVVSGHLVPKGISLSFNRTLCDPYGGPSPISATLASGSWVTPGDYRFFALASSGNTTRAWGIQLNISEASLSDYEIYFPQDEVILEEGDVVVVNLVTGSINGFSETVVIELSYPDEGIGVSISQTTHVPSQNSTVTLTGITPGGPYVIRARGVYNDTAKETVLRCLVIPAPPSLEIMPPEGAPQIEKVGSIGVCSFRLRLVPKGGVIEDISFGSDSPDRNVTISMDPSEIKRLPYPLNVTVTVKAPYGQFPENLSLSVTHGGEDKMQRVHVEFDPSDDSNDDGIDIWIIIATGAVLIVVLAVGTIVYLLLKRGNSINRDEAVGGVDNKGSHHDNETRQRDHGGRGRPPWMGAGFERGGPR